MQESYGEGVANHTGPELCVVHREVGGEALVGARAGRVSSPEITSIGVPTSSVGTEGNIPPILDAPIISVTIARFLLYKAVTSRLVTECL
jgi:hypothetical protein